MSFNFTLVKDEDGDRNITIFADGKILDPIREDHPNWEQIFKAIVVEGSEDLNAIQDLLDIATEAAKKFNRLSDRVSIKGGRVYVDHDEVNNALTQQIIRFMAEGLPFGPLIKFFENALANPNEHSRDQLCDWLGRYRFAITDEGKFVAYKGVSGFAGSYVSARSGPAIVDGEEHESGPVPNNVGSVVEMPRSNVQHDPSNGCSTGLHVGTYPFARGYASTVLEVHINPRDVVSVPTDCESQKMRVCSYTIVRDNVTSAVEGALVLTGKDKAPQVRKPTPKPEPTLAPVPEPVDTDLDNTAANEDPVILPKSKPVIVRGDGEVKHPSKKSFADMLDRAQRRRQNFIKYATKQGPWTYLTGDPKNRTSWSV